MSDEPYRTATEKIQEQLRQLILNGAIPPGSRIDQAELAQRFDVSLVPVREALARLQSSGLVRIIPHRGVFSAPLSVEELIDIYHVRKVLEEQAARIAAPLLTDADIAVIDGLEHQEQAQVDSGAYDAFLETNRDLHFVIYRAAARRYLLQTIAQLWDQSARYRRLHLRVLPERAKESLFETHAIVAACHRRDADALGAMVRYKLHQTTVGLLETMQRPVPATQGEDAQPCIIGNLGAS